MKLKDLLSVKGNQLNYEIIKYLISHILQTEMNEIGFDVIKFNFVLEIYQNFYIFWFSMSFLIGMLCILQHCALFSHCH